MVMESHPAFNGESRAPHAGGGFETSKESRRRKRKDRRNDRERQHERAHAALEPLTIWVRSDPNRLQHPERADEKKEAKEKAPEPEKREQKIEAEPKRPVIKVEAKPPKKEKAPEKVDQPEKIEEEERKIPAPETPKPQAQPKPEVAPDPMNNMPVFQELPRLDIRPRHFYTEPEVRQPNTTEIEHDILPAANIAGEAPAQPQTPEQPVAQSSSSPAEKLQELAEQAARRAHELQQKNQSTVEAEPEPEQEPTLPKPQERQPSRVEMNEHVRAIAGNKYEQYETDISMDLSELLDVAESIRLEGVSVAEMYRAERIDDEGLRRIITEFLRGQHIDKIISEEILRQQLRYERDPQMRQVPLTAMQDSQAQHSQVYQPAQPRRVKRTQSMRHQADRIADRLAGGIDRAVEATENNPNAAKTIGGILAVIVYFVILILIIRS